MMLFSMLVEPAHNKSKYSVINAEFPLILSSVPRKKTGAKTDKAGFAGMMAIYPVDYFSGPHQVGGLCRQLID